MTSINYHQDAFTNAYVDEQKSSVSSKLNRRSFLKAGGAVALGAAMGGTARSVATLPSSLGAPSVAMVNAMILDPSVEVVRSLNGRLERVTVPVTTARDGVVYMAYSRTHAVVSHAGRDLLASRGFLADPLNLPGSAAAAQVLVPGARPDRRLAKWASDPLDFWRAAVELDSSFVGHLGVDYLMPLSSHASWSSGFEPTVYAGSAPAAPGMPDPDAPIVGVMDTGIDLTHPWFGPEVVVGSRNAHESMQPGKRPKRPTGHGTAVCGVIRQANPNRRLAVESISNGAGVISDQKAAQAIGKLADAGAETIVMPFTAFLTGDVEASAIGLSSAMQAVEGKVNFVASAGNHGFKGGADDPYIYPAQMPNVSAVTAAGSPVWANEGEYVDAEAQGIDVLTAYPVGGGSYVRWSGTSFAAPAIAATL